MGFLAIARFVGPPGGECEQVSNRILKPIQDRAPVQNLMFGIAFCRSIWLKDVNLLRMLFLLSVADAVSVGQVSWGEMQRRFLEDSDEIIMKGFCEREGFRRIGLGECRGLIIPAE